MEELMNRQELDEQREMNGRARCTQEMDVQEMSEQEQPAFLTVYAPLDEWAAEIGVVAVANGDGIEWHLLEAGADQVVRGGAMMDPTMMDLTTEKMAQAIMAVPARVVLVLPNAANLTATAQCAIDLVDRAAIIVPTTSMVQAFAALEVYQTAVGWKANMETMTMMAKQAITGQVIVAGRDEERGGVKIRAGDMVALIDGRIAFVDRSLVPVTVRLVEAMIKRFWFEDTLTIFYGKEVTKAQAERVKSKILDIYGWDMEVKMLDGGQETCRFLIWI
jgi:dihydroxyacetone kinase-like predicted kinase